MSSGCSRGRGTRIVDYQAVIEVFPEAARFEKRLEVLCVAAMIRTSTLDGRRSADALEAPFLQDPEELDLGRGRHIADLVEEDGAAVGLLEAADPLGDGAREGALLVAEQLAFQQRSGSAAQFTRTQGLPGPEAVVQIARATISLPVPFSPRISTPRSDEATWPIRL